MGTFTPSSKQNPRLEKTDWSAVQEHLDHLWLDPAEMPVVFTVWERGFGKHFIKNGANISRDVEALLDKRPNCSLGFIPNPGGTKKSEITEAVALFTEDDSGASIDAQMISWQAAGLPEPGLSIFTGGKSVHHYWPLAERISPELFTTLQQRLAQVMQAAHPNGNADSSLDDACQVMRVAGSIHPKTGNRAEIRRATGERFDIEEITAAIAAAENRFGIDPLRTAARSRTNVTATLAVTGDGTHYKHLTAAQKHAAVIDALKHCPERGLEGSGGYPTAMRCLAALVHEFGAELACDLAKQANWSQTSDWDIAKTAASLEKAPPPAGRRSTIWTVFTIAAEEPADSENPWISPWPVQVSASAPAPLKTEAACNVDMSGSKALVGESADAVILNYWGDGWAVTDKGKTVATSLNAGLALNHLRRELPPSCLRLNVVSGLVEVNGSPLDEDNLATLYAEVQAKGWLLNKEACIDAILRIALKNKFDPIADYLNFVADSTDITPVDIDKLSTNYLGTTHPDFDLYFKIALLGAVKRRFEPGCQFDTVTTLDGDGRIGKSGVWIALASPDWHSSSDAEQDKDFLLILHQAWFYEQAELDHLTGNRAAGQLKNLITTRRDSVRAPYGKGMEQRDRAGTMVGSVNGPFLQGDAALRARFLVIFCPQNFDRGERIDVERIAHDRDAIWKAAVLAYRQGAKTFLDPMQLSAASKRNLLGSEHEQPWVEPITRWLQKPMNNLGPHTTDDILIGSGVRSLDKITRGDQMELSKAMQQIGDWDKDREPTRHNDRKSRFWRRSNDQIGRLGHEVGT